MTTLNIDKLKDHYQKVWDKVQENLMSGQDIEITPIIDMKGYDHIWYSVAKKADENGSKLINVSEKLAKDLDLIGFDNYTLIKPQEI